MHTPTTKKEIENEILWNNHFITIGRKSIFFYRQWYNATVKTLSDILDEKETSCPSLNLGKRIKYKQPFYVILGCATPLQSTGKKLLTATLKTNQLLQDSPGHTL